MTDKQIIIAGVNVAGCIRLQDDEISCDLGGECKGWENCYYKQFKRKEQECERLKNAYTRLNSLYNDNCNFTDKLEQTLTEIKEIADRIVNDYDWNQATRMSEEAEKILQKISECEVEDEN